MQLLQTSDVPAAETVLTAVLRVHQLVAVIDVVETGWPRDRDSRLAERPDFGAVTSRLWSLLRTESMMALGQGAVAAQ